MEYPLKETASADTLSWIWGVSSGRMTSDFGYFNLLSLEARWLDLVLVFEPLLRVDLRAIPYGSLLVLVLLEVGDKERVPLSEAVLQVLQQVLVHLRILEKLVGADDYPGAVHLLEIG